MRHQATGWLIARAFLLILLCCGCTAACGESETVTTSSPPGPTSFGQVSEARILNAAQEPDQWFAPGRDEEGDYYSPLAEINQETVGRLGFAWEYKLGTRRGLEATPVVVDGVMYTSGNWGKVYALEATTGREVWRYDPEVPGQWGRYPCCDVVNRGIAVRDGRIYVGALDGYLHAIDAKSGKRLWRVDTLPDRNTKGFRYTITGAPLLAGNSIVIGNGGSDFAGARGSVSAYDLRTGAFRWRFFTVPRDPASGSQDQPHLEAAIKTWDRHYDWKVGGGGSVWDGMAYDPRLHLVYVGTGNAAPYRIVDVDRGGRDELYAASIVAIHADSGELAWSFQETPGDAWDYDATAKLVLAALPIGGERRDVIMQASKNGFFYVLDRRTGEFISGRPFARVSWTKGLDPKTHRPITTSGADWTRGPKVIFPAAMGAHGWQPMSYSPWTGLAYIPVIDAPMVYINTEHRPAGLIEGNFELEFLFPEDYDPKALKGLFGELPSLDSLAGGAGVRLHSRSVLRAVNPVTGKIVWEQPGSDAWDGGVMSTGGSLVFRGDAAGFLNVYDAHSGRPLKRIEVGTSIMAAPMTYRARGEQYVAVMAGYGGGLLNAPFPSDSAALKYGNDGRIVAFRLGGGPVPKPSPVAETPFPAPPPREGTAAQIARGEVLYSRFCSRCHVFGRGTMPDLRRMSPVTHTLFYEIVLNGAYEAKGMGRWDDVLMRSDAEAIHAYLVNEAWRVRDAVVHRHEQ